MTSTPVRGSSITISMLVADAYPTHWNALMYIYNVSDRMYLTHPASIVHQSLTGILICNHPHPHLRFLSLLLELMQLYIQCTDCCMGLWDDNNRWLTTQFITIEIVEILYLLRCEGFDTSSVWMHGWIRHIARIWWMNIWKSGILVNDMLPMQCIAYMSVVYCWKHILVTMHGN